MTFYLWRMAAIAAALLPVYLLLRRPWRFDGGREAALGAFILFMAALLCLALEGSYAPPARMLQHALERLATGEGINLRPFLSVRNFFLYSTRDAFLVNIVGNVVMFLPWGFGLTLLWKKNQSIPRVVALSFLLTAFIETVQLFIGRHVDVDDLIMNFTGGCLGAVLCAVLRKLFPGLNDFAR